MPLICPNYGGYLPFTSLLQEISGLLYSTSTGHFTWQKWGGNFKQGEIFLHHAVFVLFRGYPKSHPDLLVVGFHASFFYKLTRGYLKKTYRKIRKESDRIRKKVSIEQKHELTGGKRRGAFYRDGWMAQMDCTQKLTHFNYKFIFSLVMTNLMSRLSLASVPLICSFLPLN